MQVLRQANPKVKEQDKKRFHVNKKNSIYSLKQRILTLQEDMLSEHRFFFLERFE